MFNEDKQGEGIKFLSFSPTALFVYACRFFTCYEHEFDPKNSSKVAYKTSTHLAPAKSPNLVHHHLHIIIIAHIHSSTQKPLSSPVDCIPSSIHPIQDKSSKNPCHPFQNPAPHFLMNW
uniref:Uncharacterized protein n=1 Tax=Oryza brachyantha TaxID=4533 RepID=J3MXY6_ORYBR